MDPSSLTAIILMMIVWFPGENNYQIKIQGEPNMQTCEADGKDFYKKAIDDPNTIGTTWDCGVFDGDQFHRKT